MPFSVRNSSVPGIGLGLFAEARLPQGHHLDFDGAVCEGEPQNTEYVVELTAPGWYVDASRCMASYVNDGPHCGKRVNAQIQVDAVSASLVLLTPVEQGEEIFVDYGADYFLYYVSRSYTQHYYITLRRNICRRLSGTNTID